MRDLQASPVNTTVIMVTWLRPVASGTADNLLSYNLSVGGGGFDITLDNVTTMYDVTDLTPGANYTIQVCVCVCACVCARTCLCLCVCTCLCMFVCVFVCMCVYIHICLSICMAMS